MNIHRFLFHPPPKIRVSQRRSCQQVDRAAENLFRLLGKVHEAIRITRGFDVGKLDQQINITIRSEIRTHDGTERRKTSDPGGSAKLP